MQLEDKKLKDVNSPIIVKDTDDELFFIAKSHDDKFMILYADKPAPEVITREELSKIWGGTAIIKKGVIDREAVLSFK